MVNVLKLESDKFPILFSYILIFMFYFNKILGGMKNSRNPDQEQSGPEVIKHFSCSTQLSMKFILLINLKILTTVLLLSCNSAAQLS